MSAHDPWFRDADQLLEEIRAVKTDAGQSSVAGYEILAELGRGGQGVVYRARETKTGNDVAVKVLLDGATLSDSSRRRFEREIELVAELDHPGIVNIIQSGTTDEGRLFLVMDYIEGQSLGEFIDSVDRAAGDGQRRVLEAFAAICEAVGHAHQRGVIHRDLKPANVRMGTDAAPRVLDFGLAKPEPARGEDASNAAEVSITGQFLGSLPWASPEQASAAGVVDVRSDVYALGVMLYQALTGRFPYQVSGPLREVLDRIVGADPTRPRSINRNIDDDLETILLRCLSKEPDRRYLSADDLGRELRRHLAGEPIQARRDSAWYVLRKSLKRHRVASSVGALFLATVLVFAITMAFWYRRAVRAEGLAETRLTQVEDEALKVEAEKLKVEAEAFKVAVVNEYLLGAFSPRAGETSLDVHEMLDRAAVSVETDFANQPDVKAEVHYALSYWFSTFGRADEAKTQSLACLELRRQLNGDTFVRLVENHQFIAQLEARAGDFDASVKHLRQALRIVQAQPQIDADDLASVHGRLADTLLQADRGAESETHARQALQLRIELWGVDDERVAMTRAFVGLALVAQGKFDEGEAQLMNNVATMIAASGETSGRVSYLRRRAQQVYDRVGRANPLALEE